MKPMIKYVFLISFLFLSCENKVSLDDIIIGHWSIEEGYFFLHNKDVFNQSLMNIVQFKKNKCEFPIIYNTYFEKDFQFSVPCSWTNISTKDNFKIKIDSTHTSYYGEYDVRFINDEVNKLLKMELISDSIYIVCSKGYLDSFTYKKIVKKLDNHFKKSD